MQSIPYGRQSIDEEDIKSVIEVLKSDFLTQGPSIKTFEKNFALYIGSKYAIAVSNGTAALHLCAMAMNVSAGDKVITTPITFAASANCIKYCGGEVEFVDIDPDTYLLDLEQVEKRLKADSKIKGIIPVDFGGNPIHTEKLRKIADKYGAWIIEDACHAPGAWYNNSNNKKIFCGDGTYSDVSIFSFHPVKHIATGEGGMITTNNKEIYDRINILRTHGITKDQNLLHNNHGGWYYEMQELGYNYRLSDIHAALGISQLKKAEKGLIRRNEIALRYKKAFDSMNIKYQKSQGYNAYHLFVIEVDKRKDLYDYLRNNNIFSQVHYIPVHLQPYYKNLGWKEGDFPNAENYYNRCLSLPMFPTLTNEEQDYVIEKIYDFHNE